MKGLDTEQRRERARAGWTPERREKQSELAKRLVAEGKIGGEQKKAGRPSKLAPDAAQLDRLLDRVIESRGGLFPHQADFLDGVSAMARLVSVLGFERVHLEGLLVTVLQSLLHDGALPDIAVLEGGNVTAHWTKSRREQIRLRDELKTGRGQIIIPREFVQVDARRLSDQQLIELLGKACVLTARPLVHRSAQEALNGIMLPLIPALQAELAKRGVSVP